MAMQSPDFDAAAQSKTGGVSREFARGRWAICLLLVLGAAWACINFMLSLPTPEHLLRVTIYSPADLQAELAEFQEQRYWQHSFMKLGAAGLCCGAIGLLFTGWSVPGRYLLTATVGLVVGIASGLAAASLGIYLRRYLDTGVQLPLVSAANRMLATDALTFALLSTLLALPIAAVFVTRREPQKGAKAAAVIFAALLTGLLTPVIISLALPTVQTQTFPPVGPWPTAVWLVILGLLIFIVTTRTGSRGPRTATQAVVQGHQS